MTIRFSAQLPPGGYAPPAPVRVTAAQRDEQLAQAINLVGIALVDVTSPAARDAMRDRLESASKAAWAEKKPVLGGTLERLAKALT